MTNMAYILCTRYASDVVDNLCLLMKYQLNSSVESTARFKCLIHMSKFPENILEHTMVQISSIITFLPITSINYLFTC